MTMDHDMHDDGLVHSHGWATEPPPSIGMLLRPANDAASPAAVPESGGNDGDAPAGAEERRRA
jgi:hypothetical protein